MGDNYELFNSSESFELPRELFNKIMARIRKEERDRAKRRYIFFLTAVIVSFGAFVPFTNFFWQEFNKSGAFHFFAFIFSDFRAVLANWQDFVLAIFELFPSASLMMSFTALFIFLWSIKNMVDIKIKYQIINKLI